MMSSQRGVRTIVAGGRPVKGPMQAVSGSREAIDYSAERLDYDFATAQSLNDTANDQLPQVRDPGVYTTWFGFNLRDQIRKDDTTPLQFKYEAANCRIYYTIANVYSMSRLWRDAANAIWEDSSVCANGSSVCANGSLDYATTGTSSIPKSPPSISVQVPSADLSSLELGDADFNSEPTGNLVDGPPILPGQIGFEISADGSFSL